MERIFYNLDRKYKYTAMAVLISGICAHGFMFTNKISFHDDIFSLFGCGATIEAGRWALEIIVQVLRYTVGKYSMPVWTGVLTLLFIWASACIIIDLVQINNVNHCVLIGSLMTVFPAVTLTYLYMFTASCYFGALFLSVLSVWLLEKYRNIWGTITAIFCIAFSMGIYQAYFSVGISLILFLFIIDVFRGRGKSVANTCRLILMQVVGLVVYFMILKISLVITGTELLSYQGMNSVFSYSVENRINRIVQCYLDIYRNLTINEMGLVGNRIIRVMLAFCLFYSLIALLYFGRMITNRWEKIFYYGVFMILPIGINLIYPMTTEESVIHPIMRYSMVFLWILPILTIELYSDYGKKKSFLKINKFVEICILITIINYIYVANIVYTKISFLQEQTNAYYTVLITQIKSCEDYQDEMPVIFIGAGGIQDETFTVNDKYRTMLTLATNDLKDWVNDYSYIRYMRYHCGFEPEIVGWDAVEGSHDEIRGMPSYPDYGSIKVIDNVVVVKMSEME